MDTSLTRTKIIATLGPSSSDPKTLRNLFRSGVDVIRLNMSHGDIPSHRSRIRMIRKVSGELGIPTAILMDLQGPKVRTAMTEGDRPVELVKGSKVTVTSRTVPTRPGLVAVVLPDMESFVKPGDPIVVSDGSLRLVAEKVSKEGVTARVEVGGPLFSRKGVHLPNAFLPIPALSPKDLEHATLGVRQKVDWFAQSFVRNAADVLELKRHLASLKASHIPVLAKIEDRFGVENLGEILEVADGILVARGDMGVCLPQEQVPILQKDIILRGQRAGKPVVTATQMLESMIENRNPTRAEVADVANAILDGTALVMLSAETASGRYPVEAAAQMERVCRVTETVYPFEEHFQRARGPEEVDMNAAMAYAAREVARLHQAAGILCLAKTGRTAQWLSRFRCTTPVFPLCVDPKLARRLVMSWGVAPVVVPSGLEGDELLRAGVRVLKRRKALRKGDPVLVVRGASREHKGLTNSIQVIEVP